MCHEPHIRFVDTHTKGDGRHHHDAVFFQKTLLVGGAHGCIQPRVVGQCTNAVGDEECGGFLNFLARETINNAGVAIVIAQEFKQLFTRLVFLHHPVADIRPIKTCHKLARGLKRQTFDNFFARGSIGCCGERDTRHIGKAFVQHRKLAILRAEIVPPLRHAVGFVDSEKRNVCTSKQVDKS